jgi:pimeloyl-ACP methyl ester carboxylesterase
VASAADSRRFPAPGRLVDIGDCRLHVDLRGEGSPAVVFEAGIAATSLSWRLVQPEIAKVTSTASYDRAWLGWSDASPQPRNIFQVVEELHTLLVRAGVAGPGILVAHSYGGLVALAYHAQYASEVAGMVLVDPVATSDWNEPSQLRSSMLRRGVLLSRRGGWLARLAVVRFTLSLLAAGGRRLPKLVARASSGPGAAFTEQIVGEIRKLPPEVWPMIRSHWSNPKAFEGMAHYLEAVPESAAAVARELAVRGTLRDVPLIVLTAGNASPEQRAEHEMLARCFQGRIEIVPGGHWLQLDRPDVVIRAINEIIAQVRGR